MFDSSGAIHQIPPSPVPSSDLYKASSNDYAYIQESLPQSFLANPPSRRIQPPGSGSCQSAGDLLHDVVGNAVQHAGED